MSIFDVDFDKWIAQMLPTFLRRRRIYAFCRAMCRPVVTVYNKMLDSRAANIYSLSHNGQVCYLRAALNDEFNTTLFEIVDVPDDRGEWVYAKDPSLNGQLMVVDEKLNPKRGEGDPEPEHPTPLLSDEARLNAPLNSFIVYVPGDIYTNQNLLNKVKAIVERYRILSKNPIYTPTTSRYESSSILINGGHHRWEWPLSVINAGFGLYPKPNNARAGSL